MAQVFHVPVCVAVAAAAAAAECVALFGGLAV